MPTQSTLLMGNKQKNAGSPEKGEKPKAEKNEYIERVKHYFKLTNPLQLFATERSLQRARDIVKTPTKQTKKERDNLSEAEIKCAKSLYESAYHTHSGELRPWISRLAAQAPLKALTLGPMLVFQETVPQLIFWQWLHHSVRSLVDYYNHRGSVPASEIGCAYSASTVGAVTTALVLNKQFKCSKPLVKRLIPLVAVTVGTMINVAMIKNRDILDGVTVETKDKRPIGISKTAGLHSALSTAISRIFQAGPALMLAPYVLHELEKKNMFCKQPMLEVIIAIGLTGLILFLKTPFVLATYGDRGVINPHGLEEHIRKAKGVDKEQYLYYKREIV